MKGSMKAQKGKGSTAKGPKGKGQQQTAAPARKTVHREAKSEGARRHQGSRRRKVRATPLILIAVALLFVGIGVYSVFTGGSMQVFFSLVIAVVCGLLGVLFLKGDKGPGR